MGLELIKVCGMTRSEDALLAAELGAAAVGFVFYEPSPRSIGPREAARIAGELPEGLLRVGVFVNEGVERIAAIVRECGLQVAQLHGDESVADAEALREAVPGLEVWKALRVGAEFDAAGVEVAGFDAVLLDTASREVYGGTGRTFPWEMALRVGERARVIVAGGLDDSNVAEAVARARPWGVDASSRLESAPGVKDPDKLRAFLAAAKSLK